MLIRAYYLQHFFPQYINSKICFWMKRKPYSLLMERRYITVFTWSPVLSSRVLYNHNFMSRLNLWKFGWKDHVFMWSPKVVNTFSELLYMAYEMRGDLQDRRLCFHALSSQQIQTPAVGDGLYGIYFVGKKAEEVSRNLLEELDISLRYLQASVGCLFQEVVKSLPITQDNFLV